MNDDMWKPIGNLIFTFALIVTLSAALLTSLGWPRETALFPQALGTPILVLTIIYFAMEVRRLRREGWTWIGEDTEIATKGDLVEAGRLFAWLVGYGFVTWILGFYAATAAYLFLFFRLKAKVSVVACTLSAVAMISALYGFFNLLLDQSPYDGLIVWWLDL